MHCSCNVNFVQWSNIIISKFTSTGYKAISIHENLQVYKLSHTQKEVISNTMLHLEGCFENLALRITFGC